MKAIKNFFKQIKTYPSAVIGLLLILFMIGIAVYAIVAIPYDEAIRLWRGGLEMLGLNGLTFFTKTNVP